MLVSGLFPWALVECPLVTVGIWKGQGDQFQPLFFPPCLTHFFFFLLRVSYNQFKLAWPRQVLGLTLVLSPASTS